MFTGSLPSSARVGDPAAMSKGESVFLFTIINFFFLKKKLFFLLSGCVQKKK